MKFKNALYGSIAVVASATLVFLNFSTVEETGKYTSRKQNHDLTYFNNLHGIAGAIDYYMERKKNIKTGKIEIEDILAVEKAIANFDNSASKKSSLGLSWIEMGPDNVGGRTRALMVDKNNSSKVWAGGVSGGLFVSYTGGSSWSAINDQENTLAVSCICQSKDGDIYYGTGESFTQVMGSSQATGAIGRGMYKSTDGVNFDSLPSTVPGILNSTGAAWAFVNRCATDPFDNNLIYAATNNGLFYSTDGGGAWTNAICLNPPTCGVFATGNFQDVKIGSNGVVVASNNGTTYLQKPGDGPDGFVNISGNFGPGSRFEFAIAPSNPDYIYVIAGSGGIMGGLWKSINGGDTWELQVPAGPANLFNGQADYDMALGVFPDDPEHVLAGGVELYALSGKDNTWDLVALTGGMAPGLSVHADKHAFAFPPNYNGTSVNHYYIGSDGGVHVSYLDDGVRKYEESNFGFNVTQMYAIGVSREGWVAGGTQDNGNPYVDFTGNTIRSESRNLQSGDGGYMQFSVVDPQAVFWEHQNGRALRSPESGHGAGALFANIMCDGDCGQYGNHGPWVTPLVIWESFNDLTSTDSVRFIAKHAYNAGAEIFIHSANAEYPFTYVTPVPLSVNDTVMIQDIIQTKFLAGSNKGVYMCKDVLDFSKNPSWYKISDRTGVTAAEFTTDGDIVYVAKSTQLYRISGLLGIQPDDPHTNNSGGNPQVTPGVVTTLIYTTSQFITGIGVDPNDNENVVITLGNFGNPEHVSVSSNAASATDVSSAGFTSIQGNLPAMPCYDAIIEMGNPNSIILATDYGIWSTENAWASPASVTWTEENNGEFPRVPSYMITQQTHPNNSCTGVSVSGNIYIGTHGRGMWRSENYLDPPDVSECILPVSIAEAGIPGHFELSLGLYPNPVSDGRAQVVFTLNDNADVELSVYDIAGMQLKRLSLNQKSKGEHTIDLDVSSLKSGTYFVSLTANGIRKTVRLMVL